MSKKTKDTSGPKHTGKVGEDPAALKKLAKGDFGIPARDNIVHAHDGEIEGRPAGSAPGYSGDAGARTTGVGSAGGHPGKDSGGDVDTDVIGLDGKGGLSATPAHERSSAADISTGSASDAFASGRHAQGKNTIKRGSHGTSPRAKGDSTDHSGQDASTVNPGAAGAVEPLRGSDPGAEGEITADEATGDADQGAE